MIETACLKDIDFFETFIRSFAVKKNYKLYLNETVFLLNFDFFSFDPF